MSLDLAGHFKRESWDSLRDDVVLVNPLLAEIISGVPETQELPFFTVQYRYGQTLLKDGRLEFHCDCAECSAIKRDFSRAHVDIPLGLVMEKRFEIVEETKQDGNSARTLVTPRRMLDKGELFGVFETLGRVKGITESAPWTLYAGARSIVPLAPEGLGFGKQLKALFGAANATFVEFPDIRKKTTKVTEIGWWDCLKNLADSLHIEWRANVVLFSPEWLDQHKDILLRYLYEVGYWQQETLARTLRQQDDAKRNFSYWRLKDAELLRNAFHIADLFQKRGLGFKAVSIDDSQGPLLQLLGHIATLPTAKKFQFPFLLEPAYLGIQVEETQALYHSVTNPVFTENNINGKPAQGLNTLWEEIETECSPFNVAKWEAFGANTNEQIKLKKISEFAARHFDNDFAAQIDIARRYGWHGIAESGGEHSGALRQKGFMTAFVRIAPREFPKLPVLEHVIADTPSALKDVMIVAVQHLLDTTGSLVESFLRLGVRPQDVYILGKPYSTSSKVSKSLAAMGVNVYKNHIPVPWHGFSKAFDQDLRMLWEQVLEEIKTKQIVRLIVLDDGGKCIAHIPSQIRSAKGNVLVVAVEQTKGGLPSTPGDLPLVRVADSAAKLLLESPLIATATFSKLQHMAAKARLGREFQFGVIGAGNIGRAVATYLSTQGVRNFLIHDRDERLATLFPEEQWCRDLRTLVSKSTMVFGCTGEDTFHAADWIDQMKGNRVFISCSSEDREFLSLLEMDTQRTEQNFDPLGDVLLELTAGTLTILRGGFPVNFDGSGESVPAEDIQLTRGLLLCGVIQAATLDANSINGRGSVKLDAEHQARVVRKWFELNPARRSDELAANFDDRSWIASNSGGT